MFFQAFIWLKKIESFEKKFQNVLDIATTKYPGSGTLILYKFVKACLYKSVKAGMFLESILL